MVHKLACVHLFEHICCWALKCLLPKYGSQDAVFYLLILWWLLCKTVILSFICQSIGLHVNLCSCCKCEDSPISGSLSGIGYEASTCRRWKNDRQIVNFLMYNSTQVVCHIMCISDQRTSLLFFFFPPNFWVSLSTYALEQLYLWLRVDVTYLNIQRVSCDLCEAWSVTGRWGSYWRRYFTIIMQKIILGRNHSSLWYVCNLLSLIAKDCCKCHSSIWDVER